MVNDFEVIHMGGRTYNPILGRFMQADPFVQAPNNLQNYNRYSYVLNNPMSYTDPSGYFFKKLMKATGVTAVMKFLANNALLNGIVMVALNFIPGCQGWCTAIYSAAQSYAVTGSLGGALRAGAFAYAGSLVGGLGDLGGVTGALASGVAGGILSTLQGGKFGHGFVSAGLGTAFRGLGGEIRNPYGRVAVSAVIGGTVSKVSGGKFVNGAASAAFAASLREIKSGSFSKLGDGAKDPNPYGSCTEECRIELQSKIEEWNAQVKELRFMGTNGKQAALNWLHENVHPYVSSINVDIEIGALVWEDNSRGEWKIGKIVTDYDAHSIDIRTLGKSTITGSGVLRASWHSHGWGHDPNFSDGDRRVYHRMATEGWGFGRMTHHMSSNNANNVGATLHHFGG